MSQLFGLKFTAVCVFVGMLLTGFWVWNYQEYKYEAQITNLKLEQALALQEQQNKVLQQERDNEDKIAKINQDSAAKDKKIAELSASNARFRTERGGLLVKAASCSKRDAGVASAASDKDNAGSAPAPGGVCELDRGVSELLTRALITLDDLTVRAQACYDYAKEIEAQRERLKNGQ